MAKKKATIEDSGPSTSEMVNGIYDRLHKQYGKQSIIAGSDYIAQPIMKIPFSPSMDGMTHGGFKEGSFIGITGHEKTGKTVTALSFAAICQQARWGSRPVFYGKVEGRLSPEHTQGIQGLITDKPMFNVIQSSKGKIFSAQDHLKIYHDVVKNVPGCVLVIDSISSMVDERELEDGVGTQTRGGCAKLFSQWLDLVKDVIVVNNCIVIGITHLISDSGKGGYTEKAARNWAYMCNYRLRTTWAEKIEVGAKDKEKCIGLKVHWQCTTTPSNGPPFGKAVSIIRFGVGVDRMAELIQYGIDLLLIGKKGSWYRLDYLKNHFDEFKDEDAIPKGQGSEGLYKLLKNHPEYVELLDQEIQIRNAPAASEEEEVEE